MATRNDFEQRRRERERMQKLRTQKVKKMWTGIGIAAAAIIIIVSAVSCAMNKSTDDQSVSGGSAITEATILPEVTAEPKTVIAGVENIPSPSEQNDLLKIVENSSASYYAYLTFDDGPSSKITPQILDILRRYNIKATFFEVGAYIRKTPDLTRRAHEEGHLIASHSDSHDYNKLYADETAFKAEIEDSYKAICDVTGEEPFRLFRFPGGSYNEGDHAAEKQNYKKTLADMDCYYIDWNTLNGDAEGRTKDADGLFEYFKKYMPEAGTNIVVLMHESSTKQATVDALPRIIEYLLDEGYTFHTLDDIPYDASLSQETSSPSPTEQT